MVPPRYLLLALCTISVLLIYAFSHWVLSVRPRVREDVLQANLHNLSLAPIISQATHQVNVRTLLSPTVVPPSAWVKYTNKWHGLPLPVITCIPLGRLGNIMGEYATLYALKRHYNTTIVVHGQMKRALSSLFPDTSLPNLPANIIVDSNWTQVGYIGRLYNYAPVELAAVGLLGPSTFRMTEYAFEIQLFHPFRKELKKEFTFAPEYRAKVHSFLSKIMENRSKQLPDPVFIGFHVRRTDYVKHMKKMFGSSVPESTYFNRALAYYRTKYPDTAVFIVASDDLSYAKSKLLYEDVFFSPGTSSGLDLAILTSCNHSVMTLGSFSFWSAYLAGGEVLYPDIHLSKEYRFSRETYEKVGLDSFLPLPVN